MSAALNMTSALVPGLDILSVTVLNKPGKASQVTYCETKGSFLPAGGPTFTCGCKYSADGHEDC